MLGLQACTTKIFIVVVVLSLNMTTSIKMSNKAGIALQGIFSGVCTKGCGHSGSHRVFLFAMNEELSVTVSGGYVDKTGHSSLPELRVGTQPGLCVQIRTIHIR